MHIFSKCTINTQYFDNTGLHLQPRRKNQTTACPLSATWATTTVTTANPIMEWLIDYALSLIRARLNTFYFVLHYRFHCVPSPRNRRKIITGIGNRDDSPFFICWIFHRATAVLGFPFDPSNQILMQGWVSGVYFQLSSHMRSQKLEAFVNICLNVWQVECVGQLLVPFFQWKLRDQLSVHV